MDDLHSTGFDGSLDSCILVIRTAPANRTIPAMAWYRVDKDGGNDPLLSARECAAAALYKGKVLITNGNDASTRFKDTLEFDPSKWVLSAVQSKPSAASWEYGPPALSCKAAKHS